MTPWDMGSSGTSEMINATKTLRAVLRAELARFPLPLSTAAFDLLQVRLFRVFRVFKLGRYSAGLQVFWGAISHSATSLSLLGFLLVRTPPMLDARTRDTHVHEGHATS